MPAQCRMSVTQVAQAISTETSEERELRRKRVRLALLQTQLGRKELQLETLKAKLRALEAGYLGTVGRRLAELERGIEAELEAIMARRSLGDAAGQVAAQEARGGRKLRSGLSARCPPGPNSQRS